MISPVARKLSKRHLRELEEGSGIRSEVIEARGYRTIKEKDDLRAAGYRGAQLNPPGLLIPIRDVTGAEVTYQWKANEPRLDDDGKPLKYENPKGSRVHLDVPPGIATDVKDPSVPLWITEGAKKADAAVTAGLCCIALTGVWAWRRKEDEESSPLPDWEKVALAGRSVYIAYDSDVMVKPEVQSALDGLTAYLVSQGAQVSWVLLPPQAAIAGSEKVGLDDWLVANDMDPTGLLDLVQVPDLNIRVNDVPLKQLTRQAISALHAANVPEFLFERGGDLLEATELGVDRLDEKNLKRLKHLMSESANWYRASKNGRQAVAPPADVVGDVSVAHELWNLNRLDRIVTTPVFAEDGSLRTTPGYHQPSRTIYVPPEGVTVPDVSPRPDRRDLKKARKLIKQLFEGFEFVDDADRAHAWAMLLQPFARELIWGSTPLYSVQAPRQGTGKTLLVQSALAPALGVVDSITAPHGDDEMDKRITALMRTAAPLVFLDNVDRPVNYASLASALTKPTWGGRVLGASVVETMPIQCLFALTANNPVFSDDVRRRVVPINLDARMEDPNSRQGFKISLPAWALQHRGDLVWAACTIISAWVAHGSPRPGPSAETPAMGSYSAWRYVMGGVLIEAGMPGFLTNLASKDEDRDPVEDTFETICDFAATTFGEGEWWHAKDLAQQALSAELDMTFPQSFDQTNVRILTERLGKFLGHRKGRVVNGLKLERKPKRDMDGYQWRLVAVEERS